MEKEFNNKVFPPVRALIVLLLMFSCLALAPSLSMALQESSGEGAEASASEIYIQKPGSLELEYDIPVKDTDPGTFEIETGGASPGPEAEVQKPPMMAEIERDLSSADTSDRTIMITEEKRSHLDLGVTGSAERDSYSPERSLQTILPFVPVIPPATREMQPELPAPIERDEVYEVEITSEVEVGMERAATEIVLDLETGLPTKEAVETAVPGEMPGLAEMDSEIGTDSASELISAFLLQPEEEVTFEIPEGESGVERDISSEVRSALLIEPEEREVPSPAVEAGPDLSVVEPSVDGAAGTETMGRDERPPGAEDETVTETIALLPLKEIGVTGDIAIFPFDNITEDMNAPKHVLQLVKQYLEGQGISVVDEEVMKRFLIRERIRYKGYIPGETAIQVRNRFGVKAILSGAIVSYSRDENPGFGIVVRLIDAVSGQVIWTDYASATGEDFTTFLGLGTILDLDDLVPEVLDGLFASFSMEAPQNQEEVTIAVMPFKNESRVKKAGRIAAYMFMVELFKSSGFEIIEFGNIRKSLVEMRIMEKGELNYDNIDALAETLETDWLLVGTVERYSDGADKNQSPYAEITARLLDVVSKRILWYDSHRLRGNANVMITEFGEIHSVDQVAYEVITELRERMESILW